MNLLAEYHAGRKLFGPVAEILASLRGVDAIQPDFVLGAVLENGDGVTVCNSDNFSGDGLGVEAANQKDETQ